MRSEHRDVQTWILKRYQAFYDVGAEINRQNRLPDWKRHWYQPDVVIRTKQGQIKYIVEVENDPMRKAIVGASVLADASIAELRQRIKPTLFFVVYHSDGIRQIPNFLNKVDLVRPYCQNLKGIEVHSLKTFKGLAL
ncbi:MAG: hypothetical protein HY017_17620 [Betaproteobacteria bacterium]|nr:hypothetical protein [Betaproteobacteria bacterium]